jgi:predicted hydrocarbon binding protein
MAIAERNYTFCWEDLGDITTGRPNLGQEVPVLAYRLLQYTIRDVLATEFDGPMAAALFVKAGRRAGEEFCRHVLDTTLDFTRFIAQLQQTLRDLKIGILRIEKADLKTLEMTLTIAEDLDCSGLPPSGETVCQYDEGFIAGILHTYTGKEFRVKEVDCWATGDRVCRFAVNVREPNPEWTTGTNQSCMTSRTGSPIS